MPESDAHEGKRVRAKPQQELRQRDHSTDRSHTAPNAAADRQEPQHPGESLLDHDFSQGTFERHAALLGDNRLSQPMYARQRAMIAQQLQRDYGNQYVQRLVTHIQLQRAEAVQSKLEVGPAGDKYEQEADRVAKQVVGMIGNGGEQVAQRQDLEEEELQMKPLLQRQDLEEEELQMKPLLQRQDLEEEELQMKPLLQRQDEEEELQMKPLLQRQPEMEEDELLQGKPVQRPVGLSGGGVGPEVEDSIQKARGQGQQLPGKLRSSMEGAFGADFSSVKVHTGTESDALNESVSARAFTTGQDIFFGQGEYNPGSSAGREVLAHELTHVVQQTGAKAARGKGEPKEGDAASPTPAEMRLHRYTIGNQMIQLAQFKNAQLKNIGLLSVEMPKNFAGAAKDSPATDLSKVTDVRKARHEIIYKKFGVPTKAEEKPTMESPPAILTMGTPGAGKGTLIEKILAGFKGLNFINADPDAVKPDLPEYNFPEVGQTPAAAKLLFANPEEKAEIVHDESSLLAAEIKRRAKERKEPLINDTTGKNLSKYQTLIQQLHALGFRLHLLMPTLPLAEALKRVEAGRQRTGRNVPINIVTEVFSKVAGNFLILKEMLNTKEGDSYQLYDTDVEKGQEPELVLKVGKTFDEFDDEKYRDFLKRGLMQMPDDEFAKWREDED